MTQGARTAGDLLADEIQREVEAAALAPGSIVASERELLATHQAGRSVLRQAVRILEDRGVAKMRRGQGGGLVVAEPGPAAAARMLAIQIESTLADMLDVRELLQASDNQIFSRDLATLSLEDCRELRSLALQLDAMPSEEFGRIFGHRTLLDAIRRTIPDAGLALAQWTCLECGIDLTPAGPHAAGERTRTEFWTLLVQGLEAMIAQDVARLFAIRSRQYRIMDESARDWPAAALDDAPKTAKSAYSSYASPRSRADLLTREILRDAREHGWIEGARLGGADELMQRYDVSLLVLRQAVRVLEESGAVRMQRGRHGGLFIARADRSIAVGRALRHLRAAKLSSENARSFLVELLLGCLSLSRSRATRETAARLEAVVARCRAPFLADADETQALCTAIAQVGANPALTIFIEILVSYLTRRREPAAALSSSLPIKALSEMYQAIMQHDSVMARRALLEHVNSEPHPVRTTTFA